MGVILLMKATAQMIIMSPWTLMMAVMLPITMIVMLPITMIVMLPTATMIGMAAMMIENSLSFQDKVDLEGGLCNCCSNAATIICVLITTL